MAKWIRFEQGGKTGFGTLEGESIIVHSGDMFAGAKPSGETLKVWRRRDPDAVPAVENDLPVEQLPPARGQERFQGAERAALVPQGAECLLAGEQADRASRHLCRKDHLRRRTRRRHRQEVLQHLGSRGRRLYLRLHLRERRHRRRSPAQGQVVRAMGARQEFRHVRCVRSGDRHRPRSAEAVGQDHPQRQGAAELSGRRHVLPAAPAGRRHFEGHDLDAGRHHRLRHFARRRHHGATPTTWSTS